MCRRADAAQCIGRGIPAVSRCFARVEDFQQRWHGSRCVGTDGRDGHGRLAPNDRIAVLKRLDHVVDYGFGRRPHGRQNLEHRSPQHWIREPAPQRLQSRRPQSDERSAAAEPHIRIGVGEQVGKFVG